MSGHNALETVLQMGAAANLRAEGMTVPEIAARLGLTERTARRRLAANRRLAALTQTAPAGRPGHEAAGGVESMSCSSTPGRRPQTDAQEGER